MPSQNDNFRIEAGKPIDDRYTKLGVPYSDVGEVNSSIVISRRYRGLTVLIGTEEYWYLHSINDPDLILKTVEPTGEDEEFNVDGGVASSIYNTIPGMDGGNAAGA